MSDQAPLPAGPRASMHHDDLHHDDLHHDDLHHDDLHHDDLHYDDLHYDERLRVPWSWWALGVVAGGLLVDEVDTTLIVGQVWAGWRATSIAFFVILFVTALLSLSLTRVAVVGDVLLAAGDRLPLADVGGLHPVDDAMRRRLMGPHGNRMAHLATRPWIKTALVLQIVRPGSAAPYWLVSTRHPEALAAAIAARRGSASGQPLGQPSARPEQPEQPAQPAQPAEPSS